ncbi:hypothetical protein BJ170DRAFT_641877 [Xylariales sp. AK1849]|nr:hypothetical protein BJ170DRAFT_641877 [Xylariales sp. AK1849]
MKIHIRNQNSNNPDRRRWAKGSRLSSKIERKCRDLSTALDYTSRIRLFYHLPDWQDINGTIHEVGYFHSQQKLCHRVGMHRSYDRRLLRHAAFKAIRANQLHAKFIGDGTPQGPWNIHWLRAEQTGS